MGHEIPTSQMQYYTDYKETDQKGQEETVLDNVENIKYLGITITNDLKWNTHVSNICTKANRTLGFLRRNLSACPQDVKESDTKDWCAQSWSTVVPFGSPQAYFFKRNLRMYRKGQLNL